MICFLKFTITDLTKDLILCICCCIECKAPRIVSLELPVLVYQEVVGLNVLLHPAIPTFPHSLIVPKYISVDSSAGRLTLVNLIGFPVHTVTAMRSADRPILKIRIDLNDVPDPMRALRSRLALPAYWFCVQVLANNFYN